jgi:hypothetical protein
MRIVQLFNLTYTLKVKVNVHLYYLIFTLNIKKNTPWLLNDYPDIRVDVTPL